MYDFNPLASLFLLKALPADLPIPSLRQIIRSLISRIPRPTPRFRSTPTVDHQKCDRDFTWPVHASHPSYNLHSPTDSDVPTR